MNLTFDRLMENYQVLTEWDQRFSYIISIGKQLPPMPDELKTEDRRVLGCMSQVWIEMKPPASMSDPIVFLADSDATIVRGLIALLMAVFREKSAIEAIKVDVEAIFKQLELDQHLSPGRANGFHSMVKTIKKLCLMSIMKNDDH